MVNSAENENGGDRSFGLDQPPIRRILPEREVGACVIVIGSVAAEHVMEMALDKVA